MTVYRKAFSIARQTMFIPPAPAAAMLCRLHHNYVHLTSSVAFPHSSIPLIQPPVNQWSFNTPRNQVSPPIPALVPSKLLQFATKRCMSFFSITESPMTSAQALFVARRPEQTSDKVQRITNPTWWTRCILFFCCVSVQSADTNGRQ
ncbi:hypothetical protein K503DRAFT_61829 [Rhizopogon vinicolor AM-OR11-026]|uniref:Uncharacterized protein n=1 Tax=Rhizopogon vinicolor AM-OR11-026 TaxID=1314800 RepID=A0A1B7MGC1_9AGAM|nr:hypothetical protein K503DRAFT_61829 [Rhizopogon vinicolor AM-OR11-026]